MDVGQGPPPIVKEGYNSIQGSQNPSVPINSQGPALLDQNKTAPTSQNTQPELQASSPKKAGITEPRLALAQAHYPHPTQAPPPCSPDTFPKGNQGAGK